MTRERAGQIIANEYSDMLLLRGHTFATLCFALVIAQAMIRLTGNYYHCRNNGDDGWRVVR